MQPVRRQVERLTDRLPDEAAAAVGASARRLTRIRSPRQAMAAGLARDSTGARCLMGCAKPRS